MKDFAGAAAMRDASFAYDEAFDRNIGWVAADEQQALRRKRIAIAGMGGVGGVHLLTLARMGIGAFNISDLDTFELANFNRQAGATLSSLGRPKADVMAEMARDINPTLDINSFDQGIRDDNIDAFLDGVDLFVDGFDFFVPEIRSKVFRRCSELKIPAITAGPIGFGTCYIVFLPGKMTFEEYFRMEGRPLEAQYARFLLGLAPMGLHRAYLVDPSRLNLTEKRGPSSAAAVQLCAGVVGAEAIKILLGRGPVRAAPHYHQFDVHLGRFVRRRLAFGNDHPLQRLKLKVIERSIAAALTLAKAQAGDLPPDASEIEKILDLARWAPSGDNAQSWRFARTSEDSLLITIADDGADNVYEYNDGQPTLLAAGMLLETMRIAASQYGRSLSWAYKGRAVDGHLIEAVLARDPAVAPDPLVAFVKARSVHRRPYRRTPLTAEQRAQLQAALGADLEIRWFERWNDRWRVARLNGLATDIRLRIPEAYRVHQRIIDWDRDFSPTGVAASSIGLDALTLKTMRWALKDWSRMERLNRLPAATLAARLQMDYLPGLGCAAHFLVAARALDLDAVRDPATLLRLGQPLQRFWLCAERLGLVLQPSLAPLCFAFYGRQNAAFTANVGLRAKAAALNDELRKLAPAPTSLVFLGRIGRPSRKGTQPRSVRQPLQALLVR
jgi:sulfur-carrier protein adenylyltransferase/sulfurtransferase